MSEPIRYAREAAIVLAALILGASALGCCYLTSESYATVPIIGQGQTPFAYQVNTRTGETWWIVGISKERVKLQPVFQPTK